MFCRLRRVRQRQEYDTNSHTRQETSDSADTVSLFSDYAILKKAEKSFDIGQVVRMVHNGKDFRRPVSYEDNRVNSIAVTVKLYTQSANGNYRNGVQEINIKISDIISHVNLEVDVQSGEYKLDTCTKEELDNAVTKLCPSSSVTRTSQSLRRVHQQQQDDDGRRRITVEPTLVNDGRRQSTRRRNMLIPQFF